jgi:hypothetical protein
MQNCQTGKWRGAFTLVAAAALSAVPAWAMAQDRSDGMPEVQQQGNISYVSGGVGLDESRALQKAAAQWPLELRFTGKGADYLSDVPVTITDGKGAETFKASAQGPYMLVKLPPGSYTVQAVYNGVAREQKVSVPSGGHARAAFFWNGQ